MTFVYTWNAAWLGLPADNENVSLGASRIRALKIAFGERFAVGHSLNGDTYDGWHEVVSMRAQNGDPVNASPAAFGSTYVKALANGQLELFYYDGAGNVVQLTDDGALATPSDIPSGTVMLFAQAAVPTGWTLNTSVNDRVLRVNSQTGGGQGGAWGITGATVQGHALTVAEIPSHNHGITYSLIPGSGFAGGSGTPFAEGNTTTGSTGGGAQHTHNIAFDGTWRPAYQDVIIGVKN